MNPNARLISLAADYSPPHRAPSVAPKRVTVVRGPRAVWAPWRAPLRMPALKMPQLRRMPMEVVTVAAACALCAALLSASLAVKCNGGVARRWRNKRNAV